jgi:hypothetical protein
MVLKDAPRAHFCRGKHYIRQKKLLKNVIFL